MTCGSAKATDGFREALEQHGRLLTPEQVGLLDASMPKAVTYLTRAPGLDDSAHARMTLPSALQVLACHLLQELTKGRRSFWSPYLAQLPKSHSQLSYFGPDDISELQACGRCLSCAPCTPPPPLLRGPPV